MAGLSPQVVDSCLRVQAGVEGPARRLLSQAGAVADWVRARGGRGHYGQHEGRSPLCDAILSHSFLLEASVWPSLLLQVNCVLSEGSRWSGLSVWLWAWHGACLVRSGCSEEMDAKERRCLQEVDSFSLHPSCSKFLSISFLPLSCSFYVVISPYAADEGTEAQRSC